MPRLIRTLEQDQSGDIYLTATGESILLTGAQAISNLVLGKIKSDVDWNLFFENEIPEGILIQQVRTAIFAVRGVVAVNIDNLQINRTARNVTWGEICYTVDCDNSRYEMTL